jgi:HTH-type transcriptional regulator/antitoxin MqsA
LDDVRLKESRYRGHQYLEHRSGAYCDRCEHSVAYNVSELSDAWEAFKEKVHATERGFLREVREKLRLTQVEAAELTGGGHNAFSRYERGESLPVFAVVSLFRVLDRYPFIANELLSEIGVKAESRTVRSTNIKLTYAEDYSRPWNAVNSTSDAVTIKERTLGDMRFVIEHAAEEVAA